MHFKDFIDFYSAIHKSGSIQSSRQKGTVQDKDFHRQMETGIGKSYQAKTDWLKKGQFSHMEQRKALGPGQVTCAEQQELID